MALFLVDGYAWEPTKLGRPKPPPSRAEALAALEKVGRQHRSDPRYGEAFAAYQVCDYGHAVECAKACEALS
ncbi:MAG: hypothetical protein KJZ75_11430 [Hyphomonadaceae bacterium]|nr:hypothetical protein [Hyphomonadaceae bacterium]